MTDICLDPERELGPFNEVERKNAPSVLYARGNVELLHRQPRVAIVGARAVSVEGRARTRKLVRFLVGYGAVIVSGLAEGVDTEAHKTAIALKGQTIAVIGTGLDECFPAKNEGLHRIIGEEHLLVSQFEVGAKVQRSNFPRRNRTMALISHATVIIEASDSSGSLSQGWEALRLGRPLFLLRSLAESTHVTWPKEMMTYGAMVLSEAEDIIPAIPGREILAEAIAF